MKNRRLRRARACGCLFLTSACVVGAFACGSDRVTTVPEVALPEASVNDQGGDGAAPPDAPPTPTPTRPTLVCPGDDAGSTCSGINFPACCSPSTGRCGEINPFVNKCFEFNAPGELNLDCATFTPPQGGMQQPGCCRSDSTCGYFSEFLSSVSPFTYGCGNTANYTVPGQTVAAQPCPADPCKTVFFDIHATDDPADGTHFMSNTAQGNNGGVAGVVHLNLRLDKLAPVVDAGIGAPNTPFYTQADAGSSDFKEAPFAIRLIEPTDGGAPRVYFHAGAGLYQIKELSVSGANQVSHLYGKFFVRLREWTADQDQMPLAPIFGGRCANIEGNFSYTKSK